MTDKLTLQDCCKYPNAKILDYTGSKDNPNDYRNIYDYIYKQGQLDGMNLEEITEDIFNDYYICNCKLILRDLTQLTDEELQHIIKIYEDEPNEFIEIENKLDRIYLLDVKKHDYLRSKNILIEPEDWFEIGKAVKE